MTKQGTEFKPDFKSPTLGITDEAKTAIAQRVLSDYTSDKGARTDWDDKVSSFMEDWRLYKPAKTEPWAGCANTVMPLTSIAASQFHSRAYDAMFSSKEFISAKPKVKTLGKLFAQVKDELVSKIEAEAGQFLEGDPNAPQIPPEKILNRMAASETLRRAAAYSEAIGRQMSHMLLEEDSEFEEECDSMLLVLPLVGTAFKKTYYCQDPDNTGVKSVLVPAQKLYIPFSDDRKIAAHYIHTYSITDNELAIGISEGKYEDIRILPAAKGDMAGNQIPQSGGMSELEKNSTHETVNLDVPTETKDLQGNQNLRTIYEEHGYYDLDGDGIEEPIIAFVDEATSSLVRLEIRTWGGKKIKAKERHHFTKYEFIPNPGCAYGIGLALLMQPFKEQIEGIMNRTLDNLTINNLPYGMAKKNGPFSSRGVMKLTPGKIEEIACDPDKSLADQLYFPQFQQVNPLIVNIAQWLYELSKTLSTVSDVMSGQSVKVEPAAAVMAKIEQSGKIFSVIMKRVLRDARKEAQKIYEFYKMYEADTKEKLKLLFFMPAGFSEAFFMDFTVSVSVDPAALNRAEIMKRAEIVYQTSLTNPLVMNDPAKLWNATLEYYRSIRVSEDVIFKIIGDAPPEPKGPENLDQVTENANLIRDVAIQVLPQQDHIDHLLKAAAFKKTNHYATLNRSQKQQLEQHMREHQAFLYEKNMAATAQQQGGMA